MSSYQDIDIRLAVVESKLEFVMKAFAIKNPIDPFGQPKSLLEVYYEVKSGVPLSMSVGGEDVNDGDVSDAVRTDESADPAI